MKLGFSTGRLNLPPGIGRAGEAAARSFVRNNLDYEIVMSNFRTSEGEIDIIARSGEIIVFLEVKTRTNRKFGLGVQQVSVRKAIRLQSTAQRYLERFDLVDSDWRIDLISVEMTPSGRVTRIDHILNAIEDQA